jgi:hypothetical protein
MSIRRTSQHMDSQLPVLPSNNPAFTRRSFLRRSSVAGAAALLGPGALFSRRRALKRKALISTLPFSISR